MKFTHHFLLGLSLALCVFADQYPRDCMDAFFKQVAQGDGEVTVDIDGDDGPRVPFTVYCRDMTIQGSFFMYLPLNNSAQNFGSMNQDQSRPRGLITTHYEKVLVSSIDQDYRIHVLTDTLASIVSSTINLGPNELYFATTTGGPIWFGNVLQQAAGWGCAKSCWAGQIYADASIDLNGTPFLISEINTFTPRGASPQGSAIVTEKTVTLTGDGFCGAIGPDNNYLILEVEQVLIPTCNNGSLKHVVFGEQSIYAQQWHPVYLDEDALNATAVTDAAGVPYNFAGYGSINITLPDILDQINFCEEEEGCSIYAGESSDEYERGNPKYSAVGIWSSSPSSIERVGEMLAFNLFDSEELGSIDVPFAEEGEELYLFVAFNDDVHADNSGSYALCFAAIEAKEEEDASTLSLTPDSNVDACQFGAVQQTFTTQGSRKRQADSIVLLSTIDVSFTSNVSLTETVQVDVYEGSPTTGTTPVLVGTTSGPVQVPIANQPVTATFPMPAPVPLNPGTTYTIAAAPAPAQSSTSGGTKRSDGKGCHLKVKMKSDGGYDGGNAVINGSDTDGDIIFSTKVKKYKPTVGPQGVSCLGNFNCYEASVTLDFNYARCENNLCVCSGNSQFVGQATEKDKCRCPTPRRVEFFENVAYCLSQTHCLTNYHWMCQAVTTNYNFVLCDNVNNGSPVNTCKCKDGFDGKATVDDKCRCDAPKQIVYVNGQAKCQ